MRGGVGVGVYRLDNYIYTGASLSRTLYMNRPLLFAVFAVI